MSKWKRKTRPCQQGLAHKVNNDEMYTIKIFKKV